MYGLHWWNDTRECYADTSTLGAALDIQDALRAAGFKCDIVLVKARTSMEAYIFEYGGKKVNSDA